MKVGNEDRKKLILAGSLGVLALALIVYELAGSSGDTSPPAAATAPVVRRAAPSPVTAHPANAALDPTLHPQSMEAAEALLYTGSGRNIFLAGREPAPEIAIPKPIVGPRTSTPPPQAISQGPATPPPIDLRFFGTEQRQGGKRQAFFLKGDDVFLAAEGDIVGRRYRVGSISATSAQVTDLTNNNTQLLPLVQQ